MIDLEQQSEQAQGNSEQGAEGEAPGQAPSDPQPKKKRSGAYYRRLRRESARLAPHGLKVQPLGHPLYAPVELFGGRSIEEVATDTASVKWALAAVGDALAKRKIDPKLGNAITYALGAYAARFDREFEQECKRRELAQRDREIELQAEQLLEARRLAGLLEEHSARAPSVTQVVAVHAGLLGDSAAAVHTSRPALEHKGEVTP